MFRNNHRKGEIPFNITLVSVCSAHLMRSLKYFIEKLRWYHRNKALKGTLMQILKSPNMFVFI